jgi:hypothetical protein
MKEVLPKFLFFIAIMAISFSYGFLSNWAQIFPYQILREAHIAFVALLELYEERDTKLENLAFWDDTGITEPTYRNVSSGAGEENIFILGNDLTYSDQSTGQPLLAWIADRQGNVIHSWEHPGEIWAPLQNRDAVGGLWRSYTIGAHLYPNGDILVSYQGVNVFPISMGLAKFDKDSNLVWKRNGYYHHWFSLGPNGEIFVPSTLIGESPLHLRDREKTILCSDDRFPYDSLTIFDQNGVKIKEIDLLDAIIRSDLAGLLNSNIDELIKIRTCDPLHLNDVQILTADLAEEFPSLSAGDLLLSFRSLNGVGVLDPKTEIFKWFYVGALQRQHSPRYYDNNRVLVFDNYGGSKRKGVSRVLSVNVGSGQTEVLFPPHKMPLPSREFFSPTGGHIDIHPSGKRMLVSFSQRGIVWEIDTTTGEILWEFINTHSVNGQPGRVDVYVAKYVDNISFPINNGELQ